MPRTPCLMIALTALLLPACDRVEPTGVAADAQAKDGTGSVIFIHPDGSGVAMWTATRALYVGPDADLHWDTLPYTSVYRGHLSNQLSATSNAGGTIHAYGVKVTHDSYGTDGGKPLIDENGQSRSVMRQAIARGIPCGVVNSGVNTEPGTGCMLASVPSRSMHDDIADQLIKSGAAVILGGGERYFLPKGADGRHGPGLREDGRDLVAEARRLGFTVVFDRAELEQLPDDTEKVLGLFASGSTFNDQTEEELREQGLPIFAPQAPTLAEMTDAAIKVLGKDGRQFFLMVEEEGTDNLANKNNAAGTLLACKRADDAIGVALAHLETHPDTLVLLAADSDAGGMHAIGLRSPPPTLPATDRNGAPVDGVDGTETAPFLSKPDRAGNVLAFAVVWATSADVAGGVVARAAGLNADLLGPSFDNTDAAPLIRRTLFGTADE